MTDYVFVRNLYGSYYDIAELTLARDIEAVILAKSFKIITVGSSCTIAFSESLTPEEESTLNATVFAHRSIGALEAAKQSKFDNVERRTQELIDQGFEFPPESGYLFPTDDDMKITLGALYAARDEPYIQYPVTWATMDREHSIDLLSASDVTAFYLTGLAYIRACKDSGMTVKAAIIAATTIAEVSAIVDPR